MSKPAIVWFRLDLRLADNPALAAAVAHGGPVVPVFVWAPAEEGAWPPGAASRWWLHQSLAALAADLQRRGTRLILRRGPTLDALRRLAYETGADAVFWNRRYEPALRAQCQRIKQALLADGLRAESFNSALLFEPWEIKNKSGQPYRVFTPYYHSCQASAGTDFTWRPPLRLAAPRPPPHSLALDALELEPKPDWAAGLRAAWTPGEAGAAVQLRRFVADRYATTRDRPDLAGTSRLAPHLHFGEIAPWRVGKAAANTEYRRQLIWREFAHHLLYHFPRTADEPLRPEFARLRWRDDPAGLRAWQRGATGFPFVDAGMRELWVTGWMHNRVRMVAGSFLVKDLLLPWQDGAHWFWDTLVDADLANNTLGWQWVAGCGADAAPFFRIFNPSAQAAKSDPQSDYVRRWSPAPRLPILSHVTARDRALKAYRDVIRSGHGIAPRDPPTPPDVRFSASGG